MQNSPHRKILYVEDYEPAILIMKHIVKKMGHECVVAQTGAEALFLSQSEKYDLALIDINLPDIEGWDLARKLREQLDCNIVGFTAAPDNVPEEEREAFDSVEYKAFASEDIKQLLSTYLEKERL